MFGIRGTDKDEDLGFFYLFVGARLGHMMCRGVCRRDDPSLRRARLGLLRRVLLPGDLRRNRLGGSSISRCFFGSSIFDANVLGIVSGYLFGVGCDARWRVPDPPTGRGPRLSLNKENVRYIPTWVLGLKKCNSVDMSKNAHFHDLTPLLFMKCKINGPFSIYFTSVSDLSVLSVMDTSMISNLNLWNTRISDLSPISQMDSTELCSISVGVRTSSHIRETVRGASLEDLFVKQSLLYDLSGLIGMNGKNLRLLDFKNTFISDLSPLLEVDLGLLYSFYLSGTQVSDLTPLSKIHLPTLRCLDLTRTPASDMSDRPPEWLTAHLPSTCCIIWKVGDDEW